MLYVLMTGCKPFCPPEAEAAGEDPTRVLVRIINPWYEVPLPVYLSPSAKDLLRKLLVRQPKWRLGCGGGGAAEVRAHPFFAVGYRKSNDSAQARQILRGHQRVG